MRETIVPIESLREFRRSITELGARSPGMPGMGLAFGPTGSGKTTAHLRQTRSRRNLTING